MNAADHLGASARSNPEHPALLWPGGRFTYRELDEKVASLAAGLHKLGIRKGDRVAYSLLNGPEAVMVHHAVLRAGAVCVPLSPAFTAAELRGHIGATSPRAIVADASVGNEVMSAGPHSAPVFVIGTHPSARPFEQLFSDPDVVLEDTSHEDLAVLALTSGTSGGPKAAKLTHGNLQANIDQMLQIVQARTEPTDVVLCVLPMFHIFAMNVILGLTFAQGATVAIQPRFDPIGTLRFVEQMGVTIVVGAPPMFVAWLSVPEGTSHDLSKVRFAISGASPLPPEVIPAFREAFGVEVWEGYGLTETSPTLTTTRMAEQRPGSVGKPLPGVELRIVDASGEDVLPGDPGEVWVKGPNVFSGYWEDEDASSVFSGEWFKTGDLGYLDMDGYLWLVDRKKELIIVSGFNVFPKEVEAALLSHRAVAGAAVVGEPHPRQGEQVKAYVVLAQGQRATEQDLVVHCTKTLARFKVPSQVVFVEDLPRLLSGKVLKRMLRPDELGTGL